MGFPTWSDRRRAAQGLAAAVLALVLAACGQDEEAPAKPKPEAPQLSAARPAAARPPATARTAAPAPQPMPEIDPCALIPHGEAERIIGKPMHARQTPVRRTTGHTGTIASCRYAAGGGGGPRKALQLDLTIERSWDRKDMTLDGWWQTQTLGNPEAKRVDALDGRGYWLPQSPPLRELLIVRGSRGVYELRTAYFGKYKLKRPQIEALAAALLAAE